ncbi:MAG: hypothetical protein ACRD1P_11590 [Thermoanaerobaculia bacterium]
MEIFGNKGNPSKGKFTLNLHKKPSTCTPNENAAAMGLAAHLSDIEKLGVDPTKIHLTLQFKETGHIMCLSLSRGSQGDVAFTPCEN